MDKKTKSKNEIEKVLTSRSSPLAAIVAQASTIDAVDLDVLQEILNELTDEFSEKGLRADSEPNEYGLKIESLIDALGYARRNS